MDQQVRQNHTDHKYQDVSTGVPLTVASADIIQSGGTPQNDRF